MIAKDLKKNSVEEQKPQKSQLLILQHAEEAAMTQLDRNMKGLLLSALSAGLDIGFSVLLMTVVYGNFHGFVSEPALKFMVALCYPIGFIFVILGRSELFTEHTTLAILPVLQKLASFRKLFRLWFLVYVGNLVGGFFFAFVLSYFAGTLDFIQGFALEKISMELIHYGWWTTLWSAVLAGWLMGLLAWLVAASRETISQLVMIVLVTATIGIIGLPHCIVGNIEVSSGLFAGAISLGEYFGFMVPATMGNIIGGVLFVGILKFNHTVHHGEEKDIDIEKEMQSQVQEELDPGKVEL